MVFFICCAELYYFNIYVLDRPPKDMVFFKRYKKERPEYKRGKLPEHLYMFREKLSAQERELYLDLILTMVEIMRENNVTFFIGAGTLLGSLRHHCFIPYDDDVDIYVDYAKHKTLEDLLRIHGYVYATNEGRGKFYNNRSRFTQRLWRLFWKWPFVDIIYFTDNGTHITEVAWPLSGHSYRRELVFPLHLRPFCGYELEAARDGFGFLSSYYGDLSVCKTQNFDHRYEFPILRSADQRSINCSLLNDAYPYVRRRETSRGIQEDLILGKKLINSLFLGKFTPSKKSVESVPSR